MQVKLDISNIFRVPSADAVMAHYK